MSGILSDLESAYLNRFIDETTFNSILGNLPLGDLQEQNFRKKVGLQIERPRKRVSFAQLKASYLAGHITLSEVEDWIAAEGYDDTGETVLVMEIIDSEVNAEKKAAAAAAAAPFRIRKIIILGTLPRFKRDLSVSYQPAVNKGYNKSGYRQFLVKLHIYLRNTRDEGCNQHYDGGDTRINAKCI